MCGEDKQLDRERGTSAPSQNSPHPGGGSKTSAGRVQGSLWASHHGEQDSQERFSLKSTHWASTRPWDLLFHFLTSSCWQVPVAPFFWLGSERLRAHPGSSSREWVTELGFKPRGAHFLLVETSTSEWTLGCESSHCSVLRHLWLWHCKNLPHSLSFQTFLRSVSAKVAIHTLSAYPCSEVSPRLPLSAKAAAG